MTIELSDYERDNLLALLHLCFRMPDGPPLHTGDWTAQVYYKLAAFGFDPAIHRPNAQPASQLEGLRQWGKR